MFVMTFYIDVISRSRHGTGTSPDQLLYHDFYLAVSRPEHTGAGVGPLILGRVPRPYPLPLASHGDEL